VHGRLYLPISTYRRFAIQLTFPSAQSKNSRSKRRARARDERTPGLERHERRFCGRRTTEGAWKPAAAITVGRSSFSPLEKRQIRAARPLPCGTGPLELAQPRAVCRLFVGSLPQ